MQEEAFQKFLEDTLDRFAAKLSASDRQMPPEKLARLFVDHFSSPEFWTEDIKSATVQFILPAVQKWFDGE